MVFITGHSVYFQCRKRQIEKSKYIRRTRHAAEWFIVPPPVCTGRRSYIEREQAPAATAGAIFLQVTRPGGSVPFCRRRFETAPRETGAHCVSPLPHTPTPGILPAGEKKKGDFLKSGEKGERKIDQTIIGIDHGYYAMKTRHCVFPTGITAYDHEPYTRQDVLEYEGRWYVCGTGLCPSRFRGQ